MPARVILHIGFHKTGTSSVQQVLRANRPVLKRHLAIRLKGQMTDLMHATRGYSTWRDPLTLAKAARRFDALLAGLPGMPKRTLILSAEELAGHMPGRGALADYGAAPVLATVYADAIRARFPGTDIAFLLTTRAPDTWLRSAYWEHVKSSSMTLDFDAFANRYATAAEFDTIADAIHADTRAPVHRAALEDVGDTRLGPAQALLDLAGVPGDVQDQMTPRPAANAALSDAVLLELLAANRAYPDRADRKAAKLAILAAAKGDTA